MYLLDIIPATKIPHTQQQLFNYFFSQKLLPGALVKIPLGRRQELGVVFDSHDVAKQKMAIKSADFELRNISRVISPEPILTKQQLELALWLGQYYFASPGLFVKMMMPKSVNSKQLTVNSKNTKTKQKLILAPTVAQAIAIANDQSNATLWHSGLKPKEQNKVWRQIKNGETQTIVGTRSAAFLPFANLKEIVIEDEQNPNHKSWDMFPHYDSQLVAQKLTEIFNAKLNIQDIRYHEFTLKTTDYQLKTGLVDMRAEIKDGNFSIFSRALQIAIKDALAQKQQVILFINRRGAANFILCRDCGYVAKCQNCDAPLAHHLINGRPTLLCHHCGAKDAPPSLCPNCQGHRIKTVGGGTQKVELEAQKLFPEAKIARLDSDNTPQPKDQQKIIDAFIKKEIDILVTTQILFSWLDALVPTKPKVVAMVAADTLLHIPDFRSGERTWRAIINLADLNPSAKFFVQTYNPNSSVIRSVAKNDYAEFIKEENETRQALNYPPFSQLVKLTFRHRDGQKAGQEAKILAAKLQRANKNETIEISPALPAFIPKERGKFVWNIVLKFKIKNLKLKIGKEFLVARNSLLRYVPTNWEIDVDPENLL